MAELLTVGEFSRLTHLTVKALHHYHEAAVLEPVTVDPFTGYRYYLPEQLPDAHLIRRLRDVRMPLAEVRAVLAAPDQQARDAGIAAHLDRLRRDLTDTAAAVASLQALLTGAPVETAVAYREVPNQQCLALASSVDRTEITRWCAQVYPRLYATAGRLGAAVVGPGGALYDSAWFEIGSGRVTAFLPVAASAGGRPGDRPGDRPGEPEDGEGEVRLVTVPAQRLAVALHSGVFQDLDRTYSALGRHVMEHRIGAPGPIREIYLITPADTDDPGGLRTEVCWPVGASAVPDSTAPISTQE
jgi:DNA-binding transcriptional MerR regulator